MRLRRIRKGQPANDARCRCLDMILVPETKPSCSWRHALERSNHVGASVVCMLGRLDTSSHLRYKTRGSLFEMRCLADRESTSQMLTRTPEVSNSAKAALNQIEGVFTPRRLSVLLAVFLSVGFYSFRSTTFIGDGLRHLPALRMITEGSPVDFQPKPWLEVYTAHYDRAVVRNHFLFGLAMRAAFALQRALGIHGDATIAMQATNAISSAVAASLFFLLIVRLEVPKWISLAVTLGVCLSPSYLLEATNIAEVPIALPFFMASLLVMADGDFRVPHAVVAGICSGMTAITYLLAGSVVPSITLAVFASRRPFRKAINAILVYLFVFTVVFLGLWVVVLLLSGMQGVGNLAAAILKSPQQGTYGGFKLGSLVAGPIGLTQAFFPILPEDFRGLRSFYNQTPLAALFAGIVSLTMCVIFARSIYLTYKARIIRSVPILSALLALLLVEAVCVEFDPYYPKLQIFGLLLFWLIIAVGFTSSKSSIRDRRLLQLFVVAVALSGARVLWTNVQPSLSNGNAQELHSVVGEGVLITGWSSDVAHLWLYSNGENIIPLPDFAFARNLEQDRVEADLQMTIRMALAAGTKVYFYGVFDSDDADLTSLYEKRFRLAGFTSYLRNLQHDSRPLGRFKQPGGHWIVLYVYNP
jgi:hypothetical protein